VTDDAELRGLDPCDLLDQESARLAAHLSGLPASGWSARSRCPGWSVRDVVAHLAASEDYHHACLAGTVRAFTEDVEARGGTDLTRANELGIADRAALTPEQLVAAWRADNAETRRGFRDRGDGLVDTSVGDYPCRWQAFHVAGELAVHADDIFVPITEAEREARRTWRTRFSRFALREAKPDLDVGVEAGRTRVVGGGVDVAVEDDELVEAVAGRLDAGSTLDPTARAALSTMP
jgi:uncharacterized protein (TIGR03083 family)